MNHLFDLPPGIREQALYTSFLNMVPGLLMAGARSPNPAQAAQGYGSAIQGFTQGGQDYMNNWRNMQAFGFATQKAQREQEAAKRREAYIASLPESERPLAELGQEQFVTGKMRAPPARVDPLSAIYDPDSPTGSRLVPRSEASGRPGPARQGITVGVDEKGNPIVQIGGTGQPQGAAANNTAIQKAADSLQPLEMAMKQFDPSFLTYAGRGINFARGEIEKVMGTLPPNDQQKLMEFSNFRANVSRGVALVRNEIYGTALTKVEQESAGQFIANVDQDSPTQLKAKIASAVNLGRLAIARRKWTADHGMKMADISVFDENGQPGGQMQGVIEKRSREIEAEIQRQTPGISDVEGIGRLRGQLTAEFGVRF